MSQPKDPKPTTPLLPTTTNKNKSLFSSLYYDIYNLGLLPTYDILILGFNCTFAWRCPTTTYLLPFFKQHMSKNHLDVGVGTGFFPSMTLSSRNQEDDGDQKVTIWDLSNQALSKTKNRIEKARPDVSVKIVQADALKEPENNELQGIKFDSISAFHLLHCIPHRATKKGKALFSTLRRHLSDEGVLFGCTVLGKVERRTSVSSEMSAVDWVVGEEERKGMVVAERFNWVGWLLMALYNRFGIFTNWEDGPDEFVAALQGEFELVESWIVGRILLFRAAKPRKE